MFSVSNIWIRIAGIVFFAVFLILFLNPFFLGIRNVGNIAGTVVCILGIVFFAANSLIAPPLQKIWSKEPGHFLLCILIGFISLGFLLALFISGCMVRSMNNKPKTEMPVVILGCQVRSSGPSLMLKRRLDAAYSYLSEHPDVPVIVCGGQGSNEPMTEAQGMYDYLVQKGIDGERICQEDTSTSTFENLRNAREILNEQEWGSEIIIVTDGYHQLRASMIAKDLSLKTKAVSAKTSWYLVPTYWVREWLGVCYQAILG